MQIPSYAGIRRIFQIPNTNKTFSGFKINLVNLERTFTEMETDNSPSF